MCVYGVVLINILVLQLGPPNKNSWLRPASTNPQPTTTSLHKSHTTTTNIHQNHHHWGQKKTHKTSNTTTTPPLPLWPKINHSLQPLHIRNHQPLHNPESDPSLPHSSRISNPSLLHSSRHNHSLDCLLLYHIFSTTLSMEWTRLWSFNGLSESGLKKSRNPLSSLLSPLGPADSSIFFTQLDRTHFAMEPRRFALEKGRRWERERRNRGTRVGPVGY